MNQTDPNLLVIKQRPMMQWFMGGMLLVFSLIFIFNSGNWLTGLISLVMAVLTLIGASVDTLTLDKRRNLFSVQRRFLWRTALEEHRLDELTGFEVEQRRSTSGGRTYRVAARLVDGESVPLTSVYTSGREGKRQRAEALNEWLGVDPASVGAGEPVEAGVPAEPGTPPEPEWLSGEGAGSAQPADAQAASPQLRGGLGFEAAPPPPNAQSGQTDGVNWQLERLQIGDVPGTRWFSPDYSFREGFLLVAQKPKGMRVGSGLLSGLGRMFGQQALRLYGFGPDDTPGIETAAPLEPPEPRLEPHYVTLTSSTFAARQALSPWVIIPLAAWAQRTPLTPASRAQDQSQLVVLFSPRGVTVAGVGSDTPEEIDALSNLGIEIVRALGG